MGDSDWETKNVLREIESYGPSSSNYNGASERKTRKISKDFERKLNNVNLERREVVCQICIYFLLSLLG